MLGGRVESDGRLVTELDVWRGIDVRIGRGINREARGSLWVNLL